MRKNTSFVSFPMISRQRVNIHSTTGDRFRGFTLIELLIVLSVLSILFFIVTPRFVGSLNPQKTKHFVLRLQNALVYLNEKAVLNGKLYLFTIDLDNRMYTFTVSEEGNPGGEVRDRYLKTVQFPENLRIKSVKTVPGDEVDFGKVAVPFTPVGLMFSFEIVIEEGEDSFLVIRGDHLSNSIRTVRKEANGEREL